MLRIVEYGVWVWRAIFVVSIYVAGLLPGILVGEWGSEGDHPHRHVVWAVCTFAWAVIAGIVVFGLAPKWWPSGVRLAAVKSTRGLRRAPTRVVGYAEGDNVNLYAERRMGRGWAAPVDRQVLGSFLASDPEGQQACHNAAIKAREDMARDNVKGTTPEAQALAKAVSG